MSFSQPFSCSSSPKQAQGVRLPSGRFRYLDSLDSRQYAADIGVFIAHGPVRAYVMGEACNLGDKPGGPFKYPTSDEHIAEMQEVVREAVAAGALGFSTNRLGGHRDGQGTCVPGTMGTSYEYTQLAKGAAMGGGGVAQFVSDFSSYDDLPRDPKRGWDQKRAEKRGQQDPVDPWIAAAVLWDVEKRALTVPRSSGRYAGASVAGCCRNRVRAV